MRTTPIRDGYDNRDEALNALAGITAELPRLEELIRADGRPAVSADRPWETEVNGKRVKVTFRSLLDQGRDWLWSLEIDVSGQAAVVDCYTFGVAARMAPILADPWAQLATPSPLRFTLAHFALDVIYGPWDTSDG